MRRLTKTAFLAGRQCALRLRLWGEGVPELEPEEVDPAEDFSAEGALVEALAYQLFPGSVPVAPPVDEDSAAEERPRFEEGSARTRELLGDPSVPAIRQAHLGTEDRLGVVDVLERRGDGWVVVEVKASTNVHPLYHHDLAYQWLLAEACGLAVVGAEVVFVDKSFVRDGAAPRAADLLTRLDVTREVCSLLPDTRVAIADLIGVLCGASRPATQPSNRCKASRENNAGDRPSTCGHLGREGVCGRALPEQWIWNLPKLAGTKKLAFVRAQPEQDLSLLDPDDRVKWTPAQRRVIVAAQTGQPLTDLPVLERWLSGLEFPVAYIDFEFEPGMAVPRFEGTRPYERIPFQWSMHVQAAPGAPLEERPAFLHASAADPRAAFIESLLAALPERGAVVVHYAPAERGVLKHYEDWFEGRYWKRVERVAKRLADTCAITTAAYYHPAQRGSWSIKKLAPAVLGRGYEDLALQDGMAAVRVWRQLVAGEIDDPESARRNLLDYCGRDTQLLHELVEALRRVVDDAPAA